MARSAEEMIYQYPRTGNREVFHGFRRAPAAFSAVSNREAESGIALIVVFILFVVLYLVVFQLEYSTKLEEELSEVRATESQGAFAIISVAGQVLAILAEDLQADASKQGAESATVTSSAGNVGASAPRTGTASQGDIEALRGFGIELGGESAPGTVTAGTSARGGSPSGAPGAGAASAAQGPGSIDYITESMFLPTTKNANNINVKVKLTDNEGRLDLNQIWNYARLRVETLSEEQEEDETEAAQEMVEQINRAAIDPSLGVSEDLELNTPSLEWVVPSEEARELTREMLTRVLDLMINLNARQYGFYYEFDVPDPASLAVLIEDYCYQRRSQPFQNNIALVSELMNLGGVTPELFYGPVPRFPSDEVYEDLAGEFNYVKDEFGDLVGEYLHVDPQFLAEREFQREELSRLTEQYGMFQNFPGMGLGGNTLTRNSTEIPEAADQSGLAVAPQPIGLRDLFCTISTGKININTAPPPVIYGLLLSLDERQAQKVALDVEFYRYGYQEIDESGTEGGIQGADDSPARRVGAPMQPAPDPEEELADQDLLGMDSDQLAGMSGYEDYPTNYFTSLRQLILIDGEEGDSEDLLNEEAIERIDEDHQSPLQLVTHDLENVAVFGSTYFTATLKIKTEQSPVVKVGAMVIHRDVANSRMEVLQWKEYER